MGNHVFFYIIYIMLSIEGVPQFFSAVKLYFKNRDFCILSFKLLLKSFKIAGLILFNKGTKNTIILIYICVHMLIFLFIFVLFFLFISVDSRSSDG